MYCASSLSGLGIKGGHYCIRDPPPVLFTRQNWEEDKRIPEGGVGFVSLLSPALSLAPL
jgi:hypothetical protein